MANTGTGMLEHMRSHLNEARAGLAWRERNGGYSSEWRDHVRKLEREYDAALAKVQST